MLRSTVHLDFDSDYILSDLTREYETPLVATRETVHGDDTLTFIAEVMRARDEIASRLEESDAVLQVGKIGESMILVRKRSCGATPIIREHNGILHGIDCAYGTERVFDIMTFNREDVRKIVDNLDEIGTAKLERIVQVPDRPAGISKRQQEVVKAAVEAGYYDWPREADAEEIADQLGITHPTFLEHLRKAEKKLITSALPSLRAEPVEDTASSSVLSQCEGAHFEVDRLSLSGPNTS